MFQGPAGLASLLKEGARHFRGEEEAVLRNIDAVKKLGDMLSSSYGVTGMSKLIKNFLDKDSLTNDGSVMLSELEIVHPAAKLLSFSCQMQKKEFGDGVKWVAIFASALLSGASDLMKQGIKQSYIVRGYDVALKRSLELLEAKVCLSIEDVTNRAKMMQVFVPVIATRVRGEEDIELLAGLILDACISVIPRSNESNKALINRFDTDNVRVSSILGGNFAQSTIINGMVMDKEPVTCSKMKQTAEYYEDHVKSAADTGSSDSPSAVFIASEDSIVHSRPVRVCVLAQALEIQGTESSATVLIKTADELKNFSKSEETEMETYIQGFADNNVDVIICGGRVSPLALHFLNKYNILAVTTGSKFEIKRLARTLRVPALVRMNAPMEEEIGSAEFIGMQEVGSRLVTVIKAKDTQISTLLVRGATKTQMEEVEKAVDSAISLFKASTKDGRFLPGASAFETSIGESIIEYSKSLTGLEQFACQTFGESLFCFAKIIAENAGQNSMETMTLIRAAHKNDNSTNKSSTFGVNVAKVSANTVRDVTEDQRVLTTSDSSAFGSLTFPVFDHFVTKSWAFRFALDAVNTILSIDQIIMSKPAGGPKFPNQGHWDDAEDRDGFN